MSYCFIFCILLYAISHIISHTKYILVYVTEYLNLSVYSKYNKVFLLCLYCTIQSPFYVLLIYIRVVDNVSK